MTKKHFIELADTIRDHNAIAEDMGQKPFDSRQLHVLASFCMQQNPNFNRDRWLAYVNGECGPSGGKLSPSVR